MDTTLLNPAMDALLAFSASGSLAVEPSAFASIVAGLTSAAEKCSAFSSMGQTHSTSLDSLAAFPFSPDGDADPPYSVVDGTAVLPLHGLMVRDPTWWARYLGYCVTEDLDALIAAADADPAVERILLHVRSPGGFTDAAGFLAERVAKVRTDGNTKIFAYAERACSAAYWVASQCESITAYRTASVGCIGTILSVTDTSELYAKAGIKPVVTTTGEFKKTGMSGVPITAAMKADLARYVAETQAVFDADLLSGRGWTAKQLGTVKDGRVHVGANALPLGLVDAIGSLPDALEKAAQTGDGDGGGDDDESDDTENNDPTGEGVMPPVTTKESLDAIFLTQGKQTMSLVDDIKNLFAKHGVTDIDSKPAAVTVPAVPAQAKPGSTEPSVLAITDSERDELTRLRAQNARSVADRRVAVRKVATVAFGQNSDALKNADAVIDATGDLATLDTLHAAYEMAIPETLRDGKRQTESASPGGGGGAKDAAQTPEPVAIAPADYYEKLNAGANAPKGR